MGFVFVVFDISLIIDFFIYKIYGFHINAMVINILTSPDAMDSIQLGSAPLIAFICFILLLIFFEFYLANKTWKLKDEKAQWLNKKLNKILILPLFFIIVIEKFTYGYHDLANDTNVLSKFKVIPLYHPLTYTRFAKDHFGYVPKPKVSNEIDREAALRYPLSPIEIKDPNKINIFIFASDAVQNHDVTPLTAPNLTLFSKEAYRFQNHRTGGNATRFGIFSLMYGLNSTYWFNFLAASQGPVLFNTLAKMGYAFSIISSTNTNWPEFRKTAYIDIQNSIHDQFKGAPWEKDAQSSQYFIDFIKKYDKKKPLFSFIFMDAPHGYSFPANENIFKADRDVNYLSVSKDSKDIPAIHARYKNAIHYNDKLFGKMIQVLKEKGLYDNSIIIYTSDHGEEFYEYGGFGHNSDFSKAQTNTVFIVKLPKTMKVSLPKNFPTLLTSHVDVIPTLMHMIGVTNPSSDYSNGKNLFDKNYHRDYVFCANWNNNAIITPKYTYIFSNVPDKMFQNEVRDTKTYKLLKDVQVPSHLLMDIMKENSRFLK
jgi:membrane-anchored protein YejM (alkaline phosphatase superfamily)